MGKLCFDGAGFGARERTKIESLNGYIVRRGAEFGVATPNNSALYALVKVLEEKAAGNGGRDWLGGALGVRARLFGAAELEGVWKYGS